MMTDRMPLDRPEPQIPSGIRVVVVDAGRKPPLGSCVGRTGVTYRPGDEGCYVRFDDDSYTFAFWDEMREATDA